MPLRAALRTFNMPEKRFDELAILNSMDLNAQLTKGMLIKTVSIDASNL